LERTVLKVPAAVLLALLLLSSPARALDCLDAPQPGAGCLTRAVSLLSTDLVRCEGARDVCVVRRDAAEADSKRLEAALLIESGACRRRLEDVVGLASAREARAVSDGWARTWWAAGASALAGLIAGLLLGVWGG
jgi:hypothetical protein